jgi:hypothetical protein
MTTAPTHPAAPIDDTRRAHSAALDALGEAVGRTARLWRNVRDPDAPVPGLTWTAGETAAHVIGDLRDHAETLTRYARGYITHANRNDGSPSQLSAIANDRHLSVVPERNLNRLADMLERAAHTYLATAASADTTAAIPTPNGLVINPPTMTCLLLGEQLLHGLDVARAAHLPYSISRPDALLVIPAVLTVSPQYLRATRIENLSVSYELRMRGGGRYRMAIRDGAAVVTAAGERADCTITADPGAFLLLGYGRSSQWSQIIRGRLRAGGRKPWLAMNFGSLLSRP